MGKEFQYLCEHSGNYFMERPIWLADRAKIIKLELKGDSPGWQIEPMTCLDDRQSQNNRIRIEGVTL